MLPKNVRFERNNFPKGRPQIRRSFYWGTVSLFPTESAARFAVVVSKKVLRKAHDRNRARRRLYAALESVTSSYHIVIHAKSSALTADLSQVTEDIKSVV